MMKGIGAAALLAAISWSGIADAQTREARARYEEAQRRATDGSWTRALGIYEELIAKEPTWGEPAMAGAVLAQRLNQYGQCALLIRHFMHVTTDAAALGSASAELEKCERRIANSGTLNVNGTHPAGLEITLNGMSIGAGELRDVVLAPGDYTLVVEKIDFNTFTQTFTVAPGQVVNISPRLDATIYYGTLKITVDQPGAVVAMDGKQLGTTPLTEDGFRMLSGRYLLTIDKPGYHRWQRYIDIPRNGNYENNIRMLLEGARY